MEAQHFKGAFDWLSDLAVEFLNLILVFVKVPESKIEDLDRWKKKKNKNGKILSIYLQEETFQSRSMQLFSDLDFESMAKDHFGTNWHVV